MPDPKQTPTPQQLGGQAVVKKYGPEYMREIGRRGYETTVQRYFGGDRDAANEWLARRGHYVCDEGYRRLGLGKFRDPGVHPCQASIADGPWCHWPPFEEFPCD
jgi:general stress protein YciG